MKLYKCACCGFEVFDSYASWGICRVCGWQDDVLQNKDRSMRGGANKLSLEEYQSRWPEIVREKRKKLKSSIEKGRALQSTQKAIEELDFHVASNDNTGSSPPPPPCSLICKPDELEKKLLAELEHFIGVLRDDEIEFVRIFIERGDISLGLEFLLWTTYLNDISLSQELYDSLQCLANQLHLESFYMIGIDIIDE